MLLTNGSKIKLEDGNEYVVVSGIELDEGVFCLISTITEPLDFKVVELVCKDDKMFIQPFEGWGYKHIFDKLLQKINKI